MLIDIHEHTIRNFALGDKELVNDFFDQMDGESRGFFNRADGNRNNALEFFSKNGEEPNAVRFLSFIKNKDTKEIMTGYVFAWDIETGVPTLGIAVHEDYKGKGLGRRLMNHLIDYLKNNDYGGVMLTTAFANIRGQSLYTRMGFQHIGTHTSGEMLYILKFKR
jgi:ribosomal protein S18 acetylase RimI-like enzyme